jgi:ribosomal protein S18 acetylase RimI-like enzyme
MTIADYDAVYALWAATPGLGLHTTEDSREGVAYYLQRNPNTCFVAVEQEKIIGTVLCGNDGRRGHINHMAVQPAHQRKGVAQALFAACIAALRVEGIQKCGLFTFRDNKPGNAFWAAMGCTVRDDLAYKDISITKGATA